jgi:hypothetical protein
LYMTIFLVSSVLAHLLNPWRARHRLDRRSRPEHLQEIALLFEDIRAPAKRGAEDMVRAGSLDLHGGEAA